jgi:hypothetical protein
MTLPVIPENSIVEYHAYQRESICIMIDIPVIDSIDDIEYDDTPYKIVILLVFSIQIVVITAIVFALIE